MPGYAEFKTLRAELTDGLLIITLNRPESLNAINPEMHRELEELFAQLSSDGDVNAAVLTGAGRAFCAGADVKGIVSRGGSGRRDFLDAIDATARGRRLVWNMLDVEQPIICALNGDAVGLGATIALFCDTVIASEHARIGDTHVKVGLVAGDGGAAIWPMLVGFNRAKELLMAGDLVSAREAEQIGLVNHVVPAGEELAVAVALARRLADGPKWAVRWTKAAINKQLRQNLNLILDTSLAYETLTMFTDDHTEAARAFTERRTPQFTGR